MCDCGCYHLHRTSNSSSLIVWYPFDLIVLVSVCFWVHSFLVTCCCHFLIFEGPCSIRHITHVLLFYQFNIYNLSPILKKVWTQVPFRWLQGLSIFTSCHLTYSPSLWRICMCLGQVLSLCITLLLSKSVSSIDAYLQHLLILSFP